MAFVKLVVLGLLLCGCNFQVHDNAKQQQEMNSILRTAFAKLYLAKGGLEYPHSQEALDRCMQYNDKPCLNAFKHVKEAKDTIKSLSDDVSVLDTTLDIIEEACVSTDEESVTFTCYGGIMSLYFYTSSDQDEKMLTRIKKYPEKVKNIIFNNEYYWYHNRPDPDQWIDFIASADIQWDNEAQKKYIFDMFKSKIDEADNGNEP